MAGTSPLIRDIPKYRVRFLSPSNKTLCSFRGTHCHIRAGHSHPQDLSLDIHLTYRGHLLPDGEIASFHSYRLCSIPYLLLCLLCRLAADQYLALQVIHYLSGHFLSWAFCLGYRKNFLSGRSVVQPQPSRPACSASCPSGSVWKRWNPPLELRVANQLSGPFTDMEQIAIAPDERRIGQRTGQLAIEHHRRGERFLKPAAVYITDIPWQASPELLTASGKNPFSTRTVHAKGI